MTVAMWVEKANLCLRTAELALSIDDADSVCNRAYYAMYNAARAALIVAGREQAAAAKTHSGFIASFAEHLVKSGELDRAYIQILTRGEKRRLISDYQGGDIPVEMAREAFADAKAFVDAVLGWIEAQGPGNS